MGYDRWVRLGWSLGEEWLAHVGTGSWIFGNFPSKQRMSNVFFQFISSGKTLEKATHFQQEMHQKIWLILFGNVRLVCSDFSNTPGNKK